DPLIIRINTRGLMETATMLFLLSGLWLFFRTIQNPQSGRKAWLFTGLLFGFAMVSKDVATVFLGIAFIILLLFRVGPGVKKLRYLIPTALLPYATWVGIITLSDYLGLFISHKTSGIQRFVGLVQETGYNS